MQAAHLRNPDARLAKLPFSPDGAAAAAKVGAAATTSKGFKSVGDSSSSSRSIVMEKFRGSLVELSSGDHLEAWKSNSGTEAELAAFGGHSLVLCQRVEIALRSAMEVSGSQTLGVVREVLGSEAVLLGKLCTVLDAEVRRIVVPIQENKEKGKKEETFVSRQAAKVKTLVSFLSALLELVTQEASANSLSAMLPERLVGCLLDAGEHMFKRREAADSDMQLCFHPLWEILNRPQLVAGTLREICYRVDAHLSSTEPSELWKSKWLYAAGCMADELLEHAKGDVSAQGRKTLLAIESAFMTGAISSAAVTGKGKGSDHGEAARDDGAIGAVAKILTSADTDDCEAAPAAVIRAVAKSITKAGAICAEASAKGKPVAAQVAAADSDLEKPASSRAPAASSCRTPAPISTGSKIVEKEPLPAQPKKQSPEAAAVVQPCTPSAPTQEKLMAQPSTPSSKIKEAVSKETMALVDVFMRLLLDLTNIGAPALAARLALAAETEVQRLVEMDSTEDEIDEAAFHMSQKKVTLLVWLLNKVIALDGVEAAASDVTAPLLRCILSAAELPPEVRNTMRPLLDVFVHGTLVQNSASELWALFNASLVGNQRPSQQWVYYIGCLSWEVEEALLPHHTGALEMMRQVKTAAQAHIAWICFKRDPTEARLRSKGGATTSSTVAEEACGTEAVGRRQEAGGSAAVATPSCSQHHPASSSQKRKGLKRSVVMSSSEGEDDGEADADYVLKSLEDRGSDLEDFIDLSEKHNSYGLMQYAPPSQGGETSSRQMTPGSAFKEDPPLPSGMSVRMEAHCTMRMRPDWQEHADRLLQKYPAPAISTAQLRPRRTSGSDGAEEECAVDKAVMDTCLKQSFKRMRRVLPSAIEE